MKNKIKDCHSGTQNILLINPNPMRYGQDPIIGVVAKEYFLTRDKIGMEMGDQRVEPNNGLLSIGRQLINYGHNVIYLDLNAIESTIFKKENRYLGIEEIKKIVTGRLKNIDYVLLSSLTCSFGVCSQIAHIIKKVDRKITTIIGGIFPTLNPDYCIAKGNDFDAIVFGEGEYIVPKLIKYFSSREPKFLEADTGFAIKRNGLFTKIKGHNLILDLDNIQLPAFELLSPDSPGLFRMFSARGCTSRCSFCAPSFMSQHRLRQYSPHKFVNDLYLINEKYDAKNFILGDLTFLDDERHSRAILKKIIASGPKMNFWCQTRVDRINERNLDLLKRAGCLQIAVGIESFNSSILELACKNIHIDDMVGKLALIKKYGLQVQGYFIVGLPWENRSNIERTTRFITYSINSGYLDLTHVSIYVPYPGLPLTNKIKHITDNDYAHYYQGVFLDMPPKVVYETDNLTTSQIGSLWEELLKQVTSSFKRRLLCQDKALPVGLIKTEELILGAEALTVAGEIRQESQKGKRKSILNIAQGVKNRKNSFVSRVITEDDKYVVGFTEVYGEKEMRLIVEAVDGIVDIIQLDIDRKNEKSKEAVQAALFEAKTSRIYTYSDFEAWFKSILYIIQDEKGKDPYKYEICIFPFNKCSVRLANFLNSLGYKVVFFSPKSVKSRNSGFDIFSDKRLLHKYGILISFCLDKPLIDRELVKHIKREALVIDASLESISAGVAEDNDGIIFRRPDMRSMILSEIYLSEHYQRETISSKGRQVLEGFSLVSGGVIGNEGDIVVDNINCIKRVFGVADGKGKIKGHRYLTEIDKERLRQVIKQVELKFADH